MKSVEELLSTYKSVHLNKKNIQSHFIGVPGIIWSLMLLLNMLIWPIQLLNVTYNLSLAMIITPLILLYYFKLHLRLALGLMLFMLPTVYSAFLVAQMPNALFIAIVVFVVCWVFQFIGHHYEKAKPAFFEDIMQLLIGPLFLMAEVYFMLGLEKKLEQQITPMAIEKRRQLNKLAMPGNPV